MTVVPGLQKYGPSPPDAGVALGLQEYQPPLAALVEDRVTVAVAVPLAFALPEDDVKLTVQVGRAHTTGVLHAQLFQL